MEVCRLLTARRQIIYRDFGANRIRLSAPQHTMKADPLFPTHKDILAKSPHYSDWVLEWLLAFCILFRALAEAYR